MERGTDMWMVAGAAGGWWRPRSTVVLTRLTLPGGYEWASRPAAPGARVPGGDELRVRALLIRAGVRL
ncbi:hypothetical protein [Streptomyces sp. NPDC092952]|uniref:hypothetical protein n=1 Tax=Streptomyces sp. NPDC092952 TaxID=3366018 RepID=UPI0037F76984